jgi:hypothetical protein
MGDSASEGRVDERAETPAGPTSRAACGGHDATAGAGRADPRPPLAAVAPVAYSPTPSPSLMHARRVLVCDWRTMADHSRRTAALVRGSGQSSSRPMSWPVRRWARLFA